MLLHSHNSIGRDIVYPPLKAWHHRAESEKSNVSSVHEHLCNVQLRLVEQLSPRTALDVYKAFAALRFKPVNEVHESLFNNVVKSIESLELPDVASFLQVEFLPGKLAPYLWH